MFRQILQPKTFSKNALAALLVIALSGAYCLFCCQQIYAAVSKAAHCPLSKTAQTEHCKFSKNKASETSKAATGINVCERCTLKFNSFVAKLEKNKFPQKASAPAKTFFNFLESVKPAKKSGFAGFSYRTPVRQTRDLHVRNCVFRI